MSKLKQAARQALEALDTAFSQTCSVGRAKDWKEIQEAISALREALKEHSVATTASEDGVTAPEDSNPQQVEALQLAHRHDCGGNVFDCAGCEAAYWRDKGTVKESLPVGNQQLTTDISDRIADCLVEDHVALMAENKALREALAEQAEQEPVAWTYCPECGSFDVRHEEGSHKQCAVCFQEWFSDIDYSDVVQQNLNRLYAAPQPVKQEPVAFCGWCKRQPCACPQIEIPTANAAPDRLP